MAWTRFRAGNFIALDTDDDTEDEPDTSPVEYY
jgi:hypothetical protein